MMRFAMLGLSERMPEKPVVPNLFWLMSRG